MKRVLELASRKELKTAAAQSQGADGKFAVTGLAERIVFHRSIAAEFRHQTVASSTTPSESCALFMQPPGYLSFGVTTGGGRFD
jgi:hypothetical protein